MLLCNEPVLFKRLERASGNADLLAINANNLKVHALSALTGDVRVAS